MEEKYKPQKKYDATHTKKITLKLNLNTDADIFQRLEEVGNKQGYIKRLIRAEIENTTQNTTRGFRSE